MLGRRLRRYLPFRAPRVELFGPNLMLRLPNFEDYRAWIALRQQSRAFLEPWEPKWEPDEFTWPIFAQRVRYAKDVLRMGYAYQFHIFCASQGDLLGGINLTNVRRGIAQMGTVGYWVGSPYARQGVMTEALTLLSNYAERELHLHRLEAACIPYNHPSIALLRRCGFRQEGEAKAYMKIAGTWRDHLLFSKTFG